MFFLHTYNGKPYKNNRQIGNNQQGRSEGMKDIKIRVEIVAESVDEQIKISEKWIAAIKKINQEHHINCDLDLSFKR